MVEFGHPGTVSSFFLRFVQSLLAAFALILSVCFPAFTEYTVFRGLVAAILVHMLWNVGFCVYDLYAMRCRNYHLHSKFVTLLLIGDWLVGGITLAAVSSSLAVLLFFARDTTHCAFRSFDCLMSTTSVFLAFLGWMCNAITALALLWIRASM